MINFFGNFKKKIVYNLKIFFIKNIGSRVKKYRYLNYDAGWLVGNIKKSYLSIHVRPKKSNDVNYSIIQNKKDINSQIGILLQGPISVNEDKGEFLYETIKIYKKIFSDATIVLSTWELNSKTFERFKQLNIKIIQNKEPNDLRFGSVRNIDRQILTTNSGLKYLKEKNILYSLKTRTDWRIYKPHSHYFLKNIVQTFPSESNLMNGRIIMTSMMTSKFKIYGIADTLQFGYTSDLLKFWDSELFLDGLKRLSLGEYPSVINFTPIISDVFLCSRYLAKINHNLLWTLEDWWTCLAKYFCVVDADSLDLLWTKYEDWFYEKRYYRSYDCNSPRTLEFSDWINLYSDRKGFIEDWKNLNLQEKWKIESGKLKFDKFY